MNELKTIETENPAANTGASAAALEVKPIIATARPALSDASVALKRRIPTAYADRTVRDLLGYLVETDVTDREASTMKSLRNELGAAGSYIVINGKEAKLTDRASSYFVEKERNVGGRIIKYHQLEIEVSAVQQGGYQRYY